MQNGIPSRHGGILGGQKEKKKKAIPESEMLSEAWLILPAPDTCKIQREEAEELDSRNVCSFLSLNGKW